MNDYLGLSTYFSIKLAKFTGNAKEYDGKDLPLYWRDLFGDYYAFYQAKKRLNLGDKIVLRDIMLTNWTPLSPGLYYSRYMWEESPKEARTLFRDVRFNEHDGKRILSIHYPREYEAHWDLSKGIPVVVNKKAYENIQDMINKYGAAHVEELNAILSQMSDQAGGNLDLVRGYPNLILACEGKLCLKKPGTPDPMLGTAWNICQTEEKKEEALWYRFWVGTEEHEYYLKDANTKLVEMINDLKSRACCDFDEEIVRFPRAPIRPNKIMQFCKKYLG